MSMVPLIMATLARLIQETVLLLYYGKEANETIPTGVSILRRMFTPQLKDSGS
ncbi:MAG: hypothetical protein GY916_10450 [Gammaproteobacteria bacterium]|nr:hypothetical protein [Gammaproteobacteria bacterium]